MRASGPELRKVRGVMARYPISKMDAGGAGSYKEPW